MNETGAALRRSRFAPPHMVQPLRTPTTDAATLGRAGPEALGDGLAREINLKALCAEQPEPVGQGRRGHLVAPRARSPAPRRSPEAAAVWFP
jgi:hypothetical protein